MRNRIAGPSSQKGLIRLGKPRNPLANSKAVKKENPVTIQFGTHLSQQHNIAAIARRVESLGYDILAAGDHVSFYGPVTNTFVTLAAAAGATENIKLMSSIVLLPLYPAALAAKLGSALQVASGGRYLFGIGVGGEYAPEFEACGVPIKERGARTNEALEIITRLWREDVVTYHGRFNTLNDISIAPRFEVPSPVWVAGRQEAAMLRVARHGSGWLPYMYTPEQLSKSIDTINRMAEDEGRDPKEIQHGIFLWSAVHEDGDRARQMAVDMLSENYSQDFSKLVERYALAGDPEYCRARMQEYIDAGATLALLPPATAEERVDASMALMAETVVRPLKGR